MTFLPKKREITEKLPKNYRKLTKNAKKIFFFEKTLLFSKKLSIFVSNDTYLCKNFAVFRLFFLW